MNGPADSQRQVVYSKSIYRGLPDLSSAPTGLTAVVTGANGISGAHMVRALGESPERWSKIYALSRRPPSGKWPATVQHIPVDFLESPEKIAAVLQKHDIRPDYVFFFSYVLITDENGALQRGDQRLVDKNDGLLTNFLEALPPASALPKRIFVQFGQKWYGVHLGATDIPDEEDDDRLALEPNLYYTQHDILAIFCTKHGVSWNSALPSFIIGAALDSSQSLLFPIIAYACVQKYLRKKLECPSDLNATTHENQAFNASDDCQFTWGKMWPRLANFFGLDYTGPDKRSTLSEKGTKYEPPPHVRGSRSVMRYTFSFVEWAESPENVQAWAELAHIHGLRDYEWKDVGAIFGRADFCLHRPYPRIMSATKAKKYGFFGFVDCYESILAVIQGFVDMKIVPDPRAIKPRGA